MFDWLRVGFRGFSRHMLFVIRTQSLFLQPEILKIATCSLSHGYFSGTVPESNKIATMINRARN